MTNKELDRLLRRYLDDKCTVKERRVVETWYNRAYDASERITEDEIEEDVLAIRRRLKRLHRHRPTAWIRYAAAAVLLVALGAALYWIETNSQLSNPTEMVENDIQPGGNKATLTLADGRPIELESSHDGIVLGQDITYNDGSRVLAAANDNRDNLPEDWGLATLTTPKGGQYQVALPDGTNIWLNAASSLVYSPYDTTGERVVHLEGEAYFEVARNEKRPFKVITAGQNIAVLGTHFNVSSYADDPAVKTALVEGSVRVVDRATREEALLQPGEYAISANEASMRVVEGDVMDAIAWKNGLFRFENTGIETIMRQLSRWYNVEVVFEGTKPDIVLWGEVYRNVNASQALEILTYFNLHYRIEVTNGVKRIVIYA